MHVAELITAPLVARDAAAHAPAAIDARGIARSYRDRPALVDVSLAVQSGEIHALLGPNGAGKTTLLRILGGMIRADAGSVSLLGHDATRSTRGRRAAVGLVPSGDRSFYLRISGIENLVFFGRLHGLRHRVARSRALEVLEAVGLEDAGGRRVGEYSHGMQKRLSVARALLTDPRVLLVDEATHDLDPHAARVVRGLVERLAAEGAAVVWATQRIDEIRGFAQSVTLLREGQVRYAGSVTGFTSLVRVTTHVVRLKSRTAARPSLVRLRHQLSETAAIEAAGDDAELFVLKLSAGASLGAALAALMRADVELLSCREVQSELEEAFVQLTGQR